MSCISFFSKFFNTKKTSTAITTDKNDEPYTVLDNSEIVAPVITSDAPSDTIVTPTEPNEIVLDDTTALVTVQLTESTIINTETDTIPKLI
jgi:hypothetical protein